MPSHGYCFLRFSTIISTVRVELMAKTPSTFDDGAASSRSRSEQLADDNSQPNYPPATVQQSSSILPVRMTPSGILRLPQELRDLIYYFCMPSEKITIHLPFREIWPGSADMRFDRQYNTVIPGQEYRHPLFLVSKQIGREAFQYYLRVNTSYLLPDAKELPPPMRKNTKRILGLKEQYQRLSIAFDPRAGYDKHRYLHSTALHRDHYMRIHPNASISEWREDRFALFAA